jgi:hypothetical protein
MVSFFAALFPTRLRERATEENTSMKYESDPDGIPHCFSTSMITCDELGFEPICPVVVLER